ncbi:putative cytochrome P450 monooxygenase [Morchella snyderi]|nr:putative cytochrome P450 monooxygenase [Morchella snyderi]
MLYSTKEGVFTSIVVIIVLSIAKNIIASRYFHPLSQFPGPFIASFSRLWIVYWNLLGVEYLKEYDLHKKYGPVIRITPTMLLVSDPKMLPEIYHRRADKADHYVTGSFGKTPSVFNIQPHEVHAAARKRIAQPYSMTAVKPMEGLIDARIVEWTDKLENDFVKTGKKLDFAPWITYFAYDVISEVAFGKPLGFVTKGIDIDGLIQSFHDGLPAFGFLCRLHPFTKWIKKTWVADAYMIPKPGDNTGIGNIMTFRDNLLEERIKNNNDPDHKVEYKDLLQNFLAAKNNDGSPMPIEDIKAETLLVLLAGSDTTATSVQALMVDLLSNPRCLEKLLAEIAEKDAAGLLSPIPKYDEVLEHLPYYCACLREAMRMTPAAPNIFPRVVSQGGLNLYGKHVPAGFEVTENPWISQRDKTVYGEDSEIFRPERWLEDPKKAQEMDKYDFTWGFGTRVCLGKNIALMELHKAPVQFFRLFTPELVNKDRPSTYVVAGGVSFHKDLWLNIKKRQI